MHMALYGVEHMAGIFLRELTSTIVGGKSGPVRTGLDWIFLD